MSCWFLLDGWIMGLSVILLLAGLGLRLLCARGKKKIRIQFSLHNFLFMRSFENSVLLLIFYFHAVFQKGINFSVTRYLSRPAVFLCLFNCLHTSLHMSQRLDCANPVFPWLPFAATSLNPPQPAIPVVFQVVTNQHRLLSIS
ncbi:hypothetical protein VTO42DRAFT_5189 [Malbranchea cinnamomea]